MPDLRTNADRLRDAEKAGKIREYLYTYSPRNTTADTRHVIVDQAGRERVLRHGQVADFLRSIGA